MGPGLNHGNYAGSLFPECPAEPKPAGNKAQATDWGNGAKPASIGDGQQVEAARENHDTGDHQPPGECKPMNTGILLGDQPQ